MRTIECARNGNETTLLVDDKYTLGKGWQTGTEPSGAPYYVCPYHVASFTLRPMPSATIQTSEPEPADEPENSPVEPDPASGAGAAGDGAPRS
jgi:hypothetical protein